MQQLPLFEPKSNWVLNENLPDIRGELIAIDTETRDDTLSLGRGPGWAYGAGYICGVSAAWKGGSLYAPVKHPGGNNLDQEKVSKWVGHLFSNNTIVFQNAPYDLGWLGTWGLKTPEVIHDTILAAVMIDENRLSYSLDSLCRWQGVTGKDESLLKEAAAAFGVDPKKGLWRLPAHHVGTYAEQDAVSTLDLFNKLYPQLIDQQVLDAYELDRDLIPMVIEMRRRGIRIDLDKAALLVRHADEARDVALNELSRHITIGRPITMDDVKSTKFLENAFSNEGIHFPRTLKTNAGSFKAEWMERVDHWLPKLIVRANKMQEISSKFLQEYIISFSHRGRLHAEIHSFRGDEGGTRSHRFSYSSPPLQQMPARTLEGKRIRECFLAEENELWMSDDYSQQEPRLTVHYAKRCGVLGADDAVTYYRHNPDPDYHQMVAEMFGQPRKKAKIINLGLAYGQGAASLAEDLDLPLDEGKELLALYHERVPFVGGLTKYCRTRADQRGYIKLIDGARCRFDMWEPTWREDGEKYTPAMPLAAAREKWGNRRLRRAYTHKAMNRLIQGSAARQTKLAMRECWKRGIIPLLQMHDELCFSVSTDARVCEITDIMENVIKLEVPVRAESKIGVSWGTARERRPGVIDRLSRRANARSASANLSGSEGAFERTALAEAS